jgi:hypothetical protein
MVEHPMKILWPLLLLLAACSGGGLTGHQKKDFYANAGGWDWKRLPLLEPYEIRLIDPEVKPNSWLFEFKATALLGTHHVKKVAVEDSIIYLRCGSITEFDRDTTNIGTRSSATAWFVIDVRKRTEEGFPEDAAFQAYLEEHHYPQPRWLEVDSLSETFGNNKKLPWQP